MTILRSSSPLKSMVARHGLSLAMLTSFHAGAAPGNAHTISELSSCFTDGPQDMEDFTEGPNHAG